MDAKSRQVCRKSAQLSSSLPGIAGEHLRWVATRRKESLRSWAPRMNVSVPTVAAMEKGGPRVGMGVYATALWLMGRDDGLRALAAPEADAQVLAQQLLVIQNKGEKAPV